MLLHWLDSRLEENFKHFVKTVWEPKAALSNSIWLSLRSLQTVTEYCCLWLELPLPHCATSPLATLSSAWEAIRILYLIHKTVKNLLAVLAWVVWLTLMELRSLLLETVSFSTEEDSFTLCRLEQSPQTYKLPHFYNSCTCCYCSFLAGMVLRFTSWSHVAQGMCLRLIASWREWRLWQWIFMYILWRVMSVFLKSTSSWAAVLIRERLQQGRSAEGDFSFCRSDWLGNAITSATARGRIKGCK